MRQRLFRRFDALARKAREYRREFGAAVDFRAGLHCGPLVTGEMGPIKTEIVFLGDTVNTAARIQDLCRQTGDRILASADLIDRLQLPPAIVKRSLGELRLRGEGVDLALYALRNAAEERSDKAAAGSRSMRRSCSNQTSSRTVLPRPRRVRSRSPRAGQGGKREAQRRAQGVDRHLVDRWMSRAVAARGCV